jgi:hypothetical protein
MNTVRRSDFKFPSDDNLRKKNQQPQNSQVKAASRAKVKTGEKKRSEKIAKKHLKSHEKSKTTPIPHKRYSARGVPYTRSSVGAKVDIRA